MHTINADIQHGNFICLGMSSNRQCSISLKGMRIHLHPLTSYSGVYEVTFCLLSKETAFDLQFKIEFHRLRRTIDGEIFFLLINVVNRVAGF